MVVVVVVAVVVVVVAVVMVVVLGRPTFARLLFLRVEDQKRVLLCHIVLLQFSKA